MSDLRIGSVGAIVYNAYDCTYTTLPIEEMEERMKKTSNGAKDEAEKNDLWAIVEKDLSYFIVGTILGLLFLVVCCMITSDREKQSGNSELQFIRRGATDLSDTEYQWANELRS